MTRREARELAAGAALSAVEEHAVLILLSRGRDEEDDWPVITAELERIEGWLKERAGYTSATKPKLSGTRNPGAPGPKGGGK